MAKVEEKQIPTDIVSVEAVRTIEQKRNGTIAEANQQQVTNRSESEYAVTLLKRLSGMEDFIHEELDPMCAKAYATHKTAVALRNKVLKPVLDAKKGLGRRNYLWCREEERKVEQAKIKAIEEAAKEDLRKQRISDAAGERGLEQHAIEPTEVKEVQPLIPTTKERKHYDVKVINKSLVPEEYKVVDLVRIRKLMFAAPRNEANEPIFEIPGIEVFNEPIPSYK